MKMDQILIWVLFVSTFLLIQTANSESEEVKSYLVDFMGKLTGGNAKWDSNWGWNLTSDPCTDKWVGVACDSHLNSVRKIVLNGQNFSGILDSNSLCKVNSLFVLSLQNSSLRGEIQKEISNCKHLTHLFISGNQFSGKLPSSLSQLSNLKRLDISYNNFFGKLPDLSRISGLVTFLAQNNQFTGKIPNLDFENLQQFDVSNNNLRGQIPDVKGKFSANLFLDNPGLCGKPLQNVCPRRKRPSISQFLMYSGYILLGLAILSFLVFMFVKKIKRQEEKGVEIPKEFAFKRNPVDNSKILSSTTTITSTDFKTRSEYSITSAENGTTPSSLVVLSSSIIEGLSFGDLLKAPAELLGRGKHGSTYKVTIDTGAFLAVKRIKDWEIFSNDLKKRMKKLDEMKHPNILSAIAFYCSHQEKLLVYEYQQNGSLFGLLHGAKNGQFLDWDSRLSIASSISEALAFMHNRLHDDKIAHGNLKSSNILLNKKMESCISEYGLMVVENQNPPWRSESCSSIESENSRNKLSYSTFKADIYQLGVILLELLTGKVVHNNGFDLASWVHSVVREECTAEVFDSTLIGEGASEERMVNLLQVAFKCINPSPCERPSMNQVVVMINRIKEEEERSTLCEV